MKSEFVGSWMLSLYLVLVSCAYDYYSYCVFFRSNGLFYVSKCSTYIMHGLIADQLLSIILMCPLFGSRVCTFPLLSLSCFNPVYSCEIHFKIWGSFTNLNDRKHSLSNIKCPPYPTPTTGGWTTNLCAMSNTCMNANPSIGGI